MIHGIKVSLPHGTEIVSGLPGARLLLRSGTCLSIMDILGGASLKKRDLPGLWHAILRGRFIEVSLGGGPSHLQSDLEGNVLEGAAPDPEPARVASSGTEAETEKVEAQLARYACRRKIDGDGLAVLVDDTQAIVVRATGASRVALPYLCSPTMVAGHLVGVSSRGDCTELVLLPLPEAGDHDLELVPVGTEETPAGATAVVTFVGRTTGVVVVNHPTYGRLNLTRNATDAPTPQKGDEVVLDGVVPKPGGGATVGSWWIVGARTPRSVSNIVLGPARIAEPEAARGPVEIVGPLLRRAAEAQVAVPDALLQFLVAAEQNEAFRRGIADIGIVLDEGHLGLDSTTSELIGHVLESNGVDGFVCVWGNGYFDAYGGLTRDGSLILVNTRFAHVDQVVSLGHLAREQLADRVDWDDGPESTKARLINVLDREGL